MWISRGRSIKHLGTRKQEACEGKSLAAWRRSLHARGVDQAEFEAPYRGMGSVLSHAADI